MIKPILAIFVFMHLSLVLAAQAQWADRLLGFSSEHAGESPHQYRAEQVLGKPDKLPAAGESPCAWSPATEDEDRPEWIKVGYGSPVSISQIAIAENLNPGAITHIFLYDTDHREHLIYRDSVNAPVFEKGRMFNIFTQPTPYKVEAVKVVLNPSRSPGINQIDAIGISASTELIKATINLPQLPPGLSVTVEALKMINSPFSEVLPVISPDGQTLYFDRKDHPDNTPGLRENDDIWYSTLDGAGNWTAPRQMPPPLNNYKNNYVCTVTPDGSTLLLANIYAEQSRVVGGVSISHRLRSSNGEENWSFPEVLAIEDYYNNNMFSEFFLAASREVLLLAIERDDTHGGRDLYVSFRKQDKTWTAPRNLGATVNTAGTELTPFLAADGKSLYFSSSGFSGYGTTDMYLSRRLDDTWTNWSEPVNLGKPFNSDDWDASYTLDASGEYAYFVSYSHSESADLYRAKLPAALKPDAVVLVSGKVYDAKTRQPMAADIFYETLPAGKESGTAAVNPVSNTYKVVMPVQHRFSIRAEKKGYLSVSENLDLQQTTSYREVNRDLYLVPIEVGQSFRLNNVFFEQSTAVLLPESYPELNRLVEMLKEYADLEIELSGHTDIEGSPVENMKLSKDRVRVIKEYLVSKGIADRRVMTKAHGSKQPMSTSRDEFSKQLNRRVEFKILKQ